jgi:hypothetical protein
LRSAVPEDALVKMAMNDIYGYKNRHDSSRIISEKLLLTNFDVLGSGRWAN